MSINTEFIPTYCYVRWPRKVSRPKCKILIKNNRRWNVAKEVGSYEGESQMDASICIYIKWNDLDEALE